MENRPIHCTSCAFGVNRDAIIHDHLNINQLRSASFSKATFQYPTKHLSVPNVSRHHSLMSSGTLSPRLTPYCQVCPPHPLTNFMTTSKETKYTLPRSKSKWFRGGNPTHPWCNWWRTIPRGRQTLHIHCIAICTHILPTAISLSRPPQYKQCTGIFCFKVKLSK